MDLEEGWQEEPHGAQNTHNHEHPQEQAVDDHCDEFPVLDDTLISIITLQMLCDEADAL